MEKLGIIIDVSHLSEKGFWDVYEIAKYPFVASHSCVKSLCLHPRNLNDEQIKAMIDKDCCIGINFYPEFLSDEGKCKADRICDHIEYILNMGGENVLGLGSDFDGVEFLPEGMDGVQGMKTILEILKMRGMSDDVIAKISFENLYRIFYDTLKRGESRLSG